MASLGERGAADQPPAQATLHSPMRAIVLKLCNVMTIVVLLAVVKLVKDVPLGQVIFFRTFVAIVPFWLWLRWRGDSFGGAFRTRRPWGHVTRATLGLVTMALTFLAVRALPLPEAITLQYSQPLFVVAFSALILGEKVRLFRWGAVAFGFLGVLVITWPNLTLLTSGMAAMSQTQLLGTAAALTAAATFAGTWLVVGQLVRTESSLTVVLWFWMLSSVITACTAVFGWAALSPAQFGLLALSGILGGLTHLFMAESLRYAPASTTAPFEYTSLIFGAALGFVLFGDIPGVNILFGGAMVIAAGLMILWREQRHGKPAATDP